MTEVNGVNFPIDISSSEVYPPEQSVAESISKALLREGTYGGYNTPFPYVNDNYSFDATFIASSFGK